jgi:hypothetical protein
MVINLSVGVAPLMRLLGESALTVELTIDFEHDVRKSAVAFPAPPRKASGSSG